VRAENVQCQTKDTPALEEEADESPEILRGHRHANFPPYRFYGFHAENPAVAVPPDFLKLGHQITALSQSR